MSATGRSDVRIAHDVYETPSWCVDRLLDDVQLPGGRWFEPCAATGKIIRAVNAWNVVNQSVYHDPLQITWYANELRQECFDPLVELRAEFLATTQTYGMSVNIGNIFDWPGVIPHAPMMSDFDVVISNPPYNLAEEVIKFCFAAKTVIMLLRVNFLGSKKRAKWLRQYPPDVYILPNRPSFTGAGTDATEYAWFLWPPDRERAFGRTRVLELTSDNAIKAAKRGLQP